jgi:hypothetical protein
MQPSDQNRNDRETRLARQQEMITRVLTWLREEGSEAEDRTNLHGAARYFAAVKFKTKTTKQEEAFHILFPTNRLDCLTITMIIAMDEQGQKSYESLGKTQEGILIQNKFFYDLKLALLQMNVLFSLKKNIRQLQTVQVDKDIYFDGLTKDSLFNAIYTVFNAIEIARTKNYQFRDVILPSKAGETDDNEDLK